MSVFMDLNIKYTTDKKRLESLIETAAHLGYSTVAINHEYQLAPKKTQQGIPKPTPVSELFDNLPIIQGKSRPIKVLNRLTIVASEPSLFRPNAAEYRAYDLLALQPTSEKLFHAACMAFDVDIICITVTEKLPFYFKRAPINGAIDRGLVFEIVYAPAIRDSTLRRYTITNSISLMDRSKGKNVIVSSAAEKPLELRGPYDIANLGLLFGLSEGDAKDAISSTCRSVLLHAETRKTASGVIYTVKTPTESSQQKGAPPTPQDEHESGCEGAKPPPCPEGKDQPEAKRAKMVSV
ncbi:ribonuclease P protein subunit p30 [Lampris incognitus]|uniref:ribonuclease P protein subunit p30 n=1 Tax=Lampris incognitus TaxID=2546036 RepID=UPI0024B4D6D7|nr:ribonuclease P protein subunit p30 [Lampris incognitus]